MYVSVNSVLVLIHSLTEAYFLSYEVKGHLTIYRILNSVKGTIEHCVPSIL